jgi:hypothetical protein
MAVPAAAQDGLNLPTELYVLLNSGVVERYGLGAEGVQTVTPEGEFVLDVGAAPDGNWLAYRTEEGLSLVNLFTGETVQLEGATASYPPVRGRGDTLAWSPDGDALAYTTPYGARVYFDTPAGPVFTDVSASQLLHLNWSLDSSHLAAESENNIWWIFRRDGTQLTLVSAIPSSYGTAWIAGAQLVFAPEAGGLLMMDMAKANAQTVLQRTAAPTRCFAAIRGRARPMRGRRTTRVSRKGRALIQVLVTRSPEMAALSTGGVLVARRQPVGRVWRRAGLASDQRRGTSAAITSAVAYGVAPSSASTASACPATASSGDDLTASR